ncbi:MAG TPA: CpXC domain-containing protein [Daejeonella sp.]|nr:CpXC domain-containing protein [Daejeonella sp.]
MSQQVTADITCEKCGHQFEKLVYTSVNAKQDPELRLSILNGTFFKHKCPSCGNVIESFYKVLYHDVEKKFMVWLVEPDTDNNIFMERDSLKAAGILRDYRLHISRYPFQWVERISTLEFGMDPRIIELYKFGIKESKNFPLETQNDFLHFSKCSRSFLGRTKFIWKFVYDDGEIEGYSKVIDAKKYQAYEGLIRSIEPNLKPSAWYLIDWQFPFGFEMHDEELIQLPLTSEFIEIGENGTKLPKQFLEVAERTGKGKQV